MTTPLMLVLGALALVVSVARADEAAGGAPALPPAELHGGGAWLADGGPARPAQRWVLDVHRSGAGALRGRIQVADSPVLNAGNVEGTIDGEKVSGTITDDEGSALVRFAGRVTPAGMSGTYTDRTGEVGAWRWDGPPPPQ